MDKIFSTIRTSGFRRSRRRMLGGVLGGLAEKGNVDVAFVRIGFLLLALLPGPAFIAYIAAWILLPSPEGRIILEDWVKPKSVGPGGPAA